MSVTSQQLINALRAQGVSMETIGQAVGRNRSLIRQISTGAKPGKNLTTALAQLVQGATGQADASAAVKGARVAKPAARQRADGSIARTRRKVTQVFRSSGSTTSTVRQGAARNGAKSLARPLVNAVSAGQSVALTVDFTNAASVSPPASSGKHTHSQAGPGGTLVVELDPADALTWAEGALNGEPPTEALAALILQNGWARVLRGENNARTLMQTLRAVQVRTWTP